MFKLTKQVLLNDLYVAFHDARKHKASKSYVIEFEKNLDNELENLCDELMNRTYNALPSTCFIIDYPKKREVFAAQFRDRVVHHLYFNYTHILFERTFIQDSYSCIKNRGTLYGIHRLDKHIKQESRNYSASCYVMKLDIRGYFMHIDRQLLLNIALGTLRRMKDHKVSNKSNETWDCIIDFEFLEWLTEKIILLDPRVNCNIIGSEDDWIGLDKNKTLFSTPEGKGLPIGNLTSQLFSNVYLNEFDQFMKRQLHCKHYGRYVDDAYVVSSDKEWMKSIIPEVRKFLKETLELDLHMGKLMIRDVKKGVEFLGAYVKPYRIYVSNPCLRRVKNNLYHLDFKDKGAIFRTVNSYLGMMIHYSSFNLRKKLFYKDRYLEVAPFDDHLTKMDKDMFFIKHNKRHYE